MATRAKAGTGRTQKSDKSDKSGRSSRGRVTPRTTANDRYTPPIPKKAKTSPRWMGVLIIALFVLGVLIIIVNYAGLLPGGVSNWWLVGAIGAIFGGLMVATNYH